MFLVLEKTRFGAAVAAAPAVVRRGYALLVVLVGWVFFRAGTFAGAMTYLSAMSGQSGPTAVPPMYYLSIEVQIALAVAVLLATRPLQSQLDRFSPAGALSALRLPAMALQAAVLALSLLYVAAGTYNPFIYFRF